MAAREAFEVEGENVGRGVPRVPAGGFVSDLSAYA